MTAMSKITLGVSLDAEGVVHCDETAPLATVRRTIIWGRDQDWTPVGAYRAQPD